MIVSSLKKWPLWWWLIPALLLTTWLGARGLNADAIWYDEWWSIYFAGGAQYGPISLSELIVRTSTQPWQPPIHYLLLAVWGNLAGWSAYALRALSLFLGVLAVAWTYRLGRDLGKSQLVGLGAAAAIGTSAFFIYYLHEIRTYTYHALFTVIVIWAYWQMLRPGRTWRTSLFFLFALVGLLYSHYFALLNIGALGLYHLLFVPKTRNWWRAPVVMVIAGLLFLPWFSVALNAPPGASTTDLVLREAALSPGQIIERLLFMFSNGNTALLIALIVVGLSQKPARFAGFWLVVVVGAAIIGNLAVHVLSEMRYLISAWPVLALLVGFGTAELARRRVSPALVLGAWALVGVWSSLNAAPLMVAFHAPDSDTYNNSYAGAFRELPWPALRQTLLERGQPGDVLAFHRPDAVWAIQGVFEYYFHDVPVRSTLLEYLSGRDETEYIPNARQFMDGAPRVWLAVDKTLPSTFRLPAFEKALTEDYVSCGGSDLLNLRLDLYARAPSAEPPFHFGEGIGLNIIEPPRVTENRDLSVLLGWSVTSDTPPNTYSVALHLENSEGQLVNQSDYGLPNGRYTCQPSAIALNGSPPGTYRMLVMVYNWSTGERLTGTGADGQSADRLLIGELEVR